MLHKYISGMSLLARFTLASFFITLLIAIGLVMGGTPVRRA